MNFYRNVFLTNHITIKSVGARENNIMENHTSRNNRIGKVPFLVGSLPSLNIDLMKNIHWSVKYLGKLGKLDFAMNWM